MKNNVANKRKEHVNNILSSLSTEIGKKVLVFGASNQELITHLVEGEREVTLIDIRDKHLDRFKHFGSAVMLKLVEEHKEFVDFKQEFDTIVYYDTLHHVSDKTNKLDESYQILNENGTIIMYEPNIYTKFIREKDQFGELKDSVYKLNLVRIFEQNKFAVTLYSSESMLAKSRFLKGLIIFLQKRLYDPIFRILLVAKK